MKLKIGQWVKNKYGDIEQITKLDKEYEESIVHIDMYDYYSNEFPNMRRPIRFIVEVADDKKDLMNKEEICT